MLEEGIKCGIGCCRSEHGRTRSKTTSRTEDETRGRERREGNELGSTRRVDLHFLELVLVEELKTTKRKVSDEVRRAEREKGEITNSFDLLSELRGQAVAGRGFRTCRTREIRNELRSASRLFFEGSISKR